MLTTNDKIEMAKAAISVMHTDIPDAVIAISFLNLEPNDVPAAFPECDRYLLKKNEHYNIGTIHIGDNATITLRSKKLA